MHIENDTTRVERFIATYRVRIATILAVIIAVALNIAWEIVSAAIRVQSAHLDAAVFGMSLVAATIAALAFYWGAE